MRIRKTLTALAAALLLLGGCGTAASYTGSGASSQAESVGREQASQALASSAEEKKADKSGEISEDWTGDDKEGVALYLEAYRQLPDNFMTKKEARKEGWEGGALHLVIPGMCIGGDRFGNYEESLPSYKDYQECDIDTLKSEKRGSKRIIYSVEEDDLDIWYTGDHYESFDLIYGDGE